MRHWKFATTIATAALLAGCMTSPPAPTENYYRLRPEHAVAPAVQHLPVTVQVRRFTADGLLRERAMLYSDDSGHRVLKQHAYHYWMDTPARLLHDYWAARLPGVNPTPVGQSIATEFALHGRLRRMERLLGSDGVDIALSVELRLRDTVTGRDVLQRSYDVIERASSDRVVDSVKAFEAALQAIHARFVIDLAALSSQAGRFNPTPERVSYGFSTP
jgi:ABC-type uncharacterized transport system auxiliary subunit